MNRKNNKLQIDNICRQWIAGKMEAEMRRRKLSEKKASEPKPEQLLSEKLNEIYEFRYNIITEQVEYRKRINNLEYFDGISKTMEKTFRILDKRIMFTICMEMREMGVKCMDKDVWRYIYSSRIPEYHPVRSYMENLPKWDGVNRVDQLISRVSKNEVSSKAMYRWLLALCAQWMGIDTGYGNSLAPVLISTVQGIGKSTYCKNIVPDSLRWYYTDIFDLGTKGKAEQRLTQNCLINLDEMDRLSAKKMPLLKNLMQVEKVSVCKAYKSYFTSLPRIASFICTSNRTDLLTDPTGSRRFICIRIHDVIDNSPIHHKQLYAELKFYIENGERFWLTKDEEADLQKSNQAFYREHAEMQLFRLHFRPVEAQKRTGWYKLTDIMKILKTADSETMRGISSEAMGKMLVAAGIEKEHRRNGSYYRVERCDGCDSCDEINSFQ